MYAVIFIEGRSVVQVPLFYMLNTFNVVFGAPFRQYIQTLIWNRPESLKLKFDLCNFRFLFMCIYVYVSIDIDINHEFVTFFM